MMQKGYPGDATVTVCHSRTKNLKEICAEADILIAALGQPEFLTADMVKDGATIIDVGTTRVPSTQTKSGFRLSGDVKFDEVAPKCSYITPVPGGVGIHIAPPIRRPVLGNSDIIAHNVITLCLEIPPHGAGNG
jgi:methylenetetrahydrofolate dehydrogenase (NADP+)/methenyltetrahydrofolate cyclohydrolase